jgi:hypothetical protein
MPLLTRRRGGSYVRGEKNRSEPPGRTEVRPHTAAITHLPAANKLAAIMRVQTQYDYDLPGFSHPITELFSDGQRLESERPTDNLKDAWERSGVCPLN